MPCCCRSQKITVEDIEINLEKIEEIVKENIPENIQENIQENIEENVEENIQENIEENIQENIQENIEENVDENIQENIEENVEENIHQKNEESLKVVIRDFIDELYQHPIIEKCVTFSRRHFNPKSLKYFDNFEINLETIEEDNQEEVEALKYLLFVVQSQMIPEF